jgi:hypothetical protein
MTTPTGFGTAYQAIAGAMREAKLLGRGRDPDSDHLAEYMNTLNYTFNFLQIKPGLKLWLNQDLPITPVVGQSLYTLGPTGNVPMTKPIRGFEAYYTDASANRRPVIPMGRSEWDMLSTITTQGPITSFYVDKQQLSLNVNLWLTPDTQAATGVFHLIVTQQVTGMVSITDTMSFPVEWFLALKWELAKQICSGQPQAVIDRCTQMAEYHVSVLEDWDVEDASTFFTVDARTQTYQGRFR